MIMVQMKMVQKNMDENGTNEDVQRKYFKQFTAFNSGLFTYFTLSNDSHWQIHVALSPPENH